MKIKGYIYLIHNNITNKYYIGQTIKDVNFRWKQHIIDSKNSSLPMYNYYLHKSIRKYSAENFTITTLCTITANDNYIKEALNWMESYYIEEYDSFNQGYNLTLGGGGILGRKGKLSPNYGKKFSATHKSKISESHKGKKFTEEHKEKLRDVKRNKMKAVLQYSKEGTFIKEWESTREVTRELNINNSNLCYCCLGKRKTAGGYIWKYK